MQRLEAAVRALRSRTGIEPHAALLLGPGMESIGDRISVDASVEYRELFGEGDSGRELPGRVLVGRWGATPVVAMQGALPRHDGHSLKDATRPVRVMRLLAGPGPPPPLLVAGTCVSLHPLSEPGELVLLDDHINLMGENPLVGENLDALGPRFPDMTEAYDRELRRAALESMLERRIPLRCGVYVAVTGPQLSTRAEYRMYRRIGADFVGTWIVPEVIVARHMSMPVLAVLAVDAVRLPDEVEPRAAPSEWRAPDDVRREIADTLGAVLERLPAARHAVG